MGIDVTEGAAGVSQTANGMSRIWRVRLDSLKVGGVVVHGVDAAVHINDLPVALLGMSFLNRMEMTREGSRLVLKKRF
jgi:aspartyl protease family protein